MSISEAKKKAISNTEANNSKSSSWKASNDISDPGEWEKTHNSAEKLQVCASFYDLQESVPL